MGPISVVSDMFPFNRSLRSRIATRRYDVNIAQALPFRRFPARTDRYAADESAISLPRSGEQLRSRNDWESAESPGTTLRTVWKRTSGSHMTPERVVSNSSPLMNLAIIGHLNLLQELFVHITVPQEVFIDGTPARRSPFLDQARALRPNPGGSERTLSRSARLGIVALPRQH